MGIVLGANQYGKAENHVVRIHRDVPRHEIKDVTVSTALRGDFDAAHLVGDQSRVLPTDTQKQTCYALAQTHGIGEVEDYALLLARHFVGTVEPVRAARVEVAEDAWDRVDDHDHTWVRRGGETRRCAVTVEGDDAWVLSGLRDLVVLKSTGSQFHGFLTDELTVLEPTTDRVMATSLTAWWRHAGTDVDWAASYAGVRATMLGVFADLESLALQQTLYAMGSAVLETYADVAEIRFAAPNRHHFRYDLERFGIDNRNETFHADDRPYGLIEAVVTRDDGPAAGPAWDAVTGIA